MDAPIRNPIERQLADMRAAMRDYEGAIAAGDYTAASAALVRAIRSASSSHEILTRLQRTKANDRST